MGLQYKDPYGITNYKLKEKKEEIQAILQEILVVLRKIAEK